MIPDEVLRDITSRAKAEWPDDTDMETHCIKQETEGYANLQSLDFGPLADRKAELIESAREIYDAWNDVFDTVEAEVSAYNALAGYTADELGQDLVEAWKAEARRQHDSSFASQLAYVEGKELKHRAIQATRQEIDPIKALLIELEEIVGSECYNGNIQNYASWGELDSVGRQFRYPVTFYNGNRKTKEWSVSEGMPSENLITGHYKFGSNELNIYRALAKVVSHLRSKYGLKV
ncbi:hypothetical protein [Cupriavidus campinensis]|uniref:Uncharacterized protein n=1 Tax=Cupriavidus campinensis TaxID=151783 RepID=A0ABY3ESU8_9BURK|nr:hypothetical protein [Cupriavidus campinensis]TSP14031.1 hypothetical protein FGG12_06055 [Cupriavidus campinensis]